MLHQRLCPQTVSQPAWCCLGEPLCICYRSGVGMIHHKWDWQLSQQPGVVLWQKVGSPSSFVPVPQMVPKVMLPLFQHGRLQQLFHTSPKWDMSNLHVRHAFSSLNYRHKILTWSFSPLYFTCESIWMRCGPTPNVWRQYTAIPVWHRSSMATSTWYSRTLLGRGRDMAISPTVVSFGSHWEIMEEVSKSALPIKAMPAT